MPESVPPPAIKAEAQAGPLSPQSSLTHPSAQVDRETPILDARGLRKVFTSRQSHTVALDDVSLQLYPGEVVALIGESGSGKTTLGRAITRLLSLDRGQVIFEGQDLLSLTGEQLRSARKRFQMIFQNQQAQLHPKMSVADMLDESLRLHQPNPTPDARAAEQRRLLERVGLNSHQDRYLASLSGGEQRRVGLARVLAAHPRLIVADEPTSGLDAAIKLQIIGLLRELRAQDLTYLLISHDLSLVKRIADRVLVMLRGRIIESFPLSQLGKQVHHPYTRQLIAAAQLGEEDDSSAPTELRSIEDVSEDTMGCSYASICPLIQGQEEAAQRCAGARPVLKSPSSQRTSGPHGQHLSRRDAAQALHHIACFELAP